jgi:hypothetical protein
MRLWSPLKFLSRNLPRRQQLESQLDEELRSYADMVADEKIAGWGAGLATGRHPCLHIQPYIYLDGTTNASSGFSSSAVILRWHSN